MWSLLPRLAVALGSFALAAACATTQAASREGAPASKPSRLGPRAPVDPESVKLEPLVFGEDGFAYVDGRTGAALTFDEVLARARAADLVLAGEQHDVLAHHDLQARIIRGLAGGKDPLAVGLEMVNWSQQEALDRYTAGEIDLDGLFAALDWERTWGHDADLYRDVLSAGREAKARLVALNAPRELVRAVAKQGVLGLSDEERAMLPEMDLSDEVHRASIEAVFRHHHPPTNAGDAFERFYSAQVLWDESMADRAVKALQAGAARIVVLAGVGHVAGYRGIPQRVLRRLPEARLLTVVPVRIEEGEGGEDLVKMAVAEAEGDILAVQRPREVLSL